MEARLIAEARPRLNGTRAAAEVEEDDAETGDSKIETEIAPGDPESA